MGRILRPDELGTVLGDLDRRTQKLERSPIINNFPLISSANSAVPNQLVPASGNFVGPAFTNFYDVVMQGGLTCVFTLTAPTPIIWFSYATLALSAPGGGFYAYLVTSVSLSPWNSAQWIFRSGSQIFDKGNPGYLQSEHHFVITNGPSQGSIGPGAAALGITSAQQALPAGTYEVRQQMTGDTGLLANFYQGNVEVFAPGG